MADEPTIRRWAALEGSIRRLRWMRRCASFGKRDTKGATLTDLTDAMRINRSSMWAAFGNKEELFKKAFGRYIDTYQRYMREALEKPTIREVIESSLRGTVDFLATPGNPKGCLSVHGALAVGDEADPIKRWLIQSRKHGLSLARKRFEQAKKSGDLALMSTRQH